MLQQIWPWIIDPANQRLLYGIIIALLMGFIIGRIWSYNKKNHGESSDGKRDDAFLKGVQHLLLNDKDQAIEEFTKSVQMNSDTIETYIALGNLFRLKGDTDRAINIRKTIILRPNIDDNIKLRTLYDIGLDYRKGGLLDRALEAFSDVLKKRPSDLQTLEELEKIYEELSDWENALSTRKRISKLVPGDHKHIMAHYQTEIGKVQLEQGDIPKAKSAFQRAISINSGCVDAYLHLGDMYFSNQEYNKAIAAWKKVVEIIPKFTFLAYRRIKGVYSKMENLKPIEDFLKECADSNSDAFTHLALARYLNNSKKHDGAIKELKSALELDPGFWEARRFMGEILLSLGREREILDAYSDLISHLNFPYLEFQCTNCGFKPADLQWQCPQCKKWDTINLMDSNVTDSPSLINNVNKLQAEIVEYDIEKEV